MFAGIVLKSYHLVAQMRDGSEWCCHRLGLCARHLAAGDGVLHLILQLESGETGFITFYLLVQVVPNLYMDLSGAVICKLCCDNCTFRSLYSPAHTYGAAA